MTHSLTIQLNEEAFSSLRHQAWVAGTSPEKLAAASLELQYETFFPAPSGVDIEAARARFERQFGELDLEYPSDTDNEEFDADWPRGYADR